MEKTIKLVMEKDKNLKIIINNEEKHVVLSTNRSITAEKIYELLNFSIGDHYCVVTENKSSSDNVVLDCFSELLTDIINKVNALPPYEVKNDS